MFNRSEIFKTAWTNAREIHANFLRNRHLFGTPKPLRLLFAQALSEAWAAARNVAAKARHVARVKAWVDAMPSAAMAERIRSVREQIALSLYRNSSYAPRLAALQSELVMLAG